MSKLKTDQEPVAWCVAYDDPRMGRIHSDPSMCEPAVDAHVLNCEGRISKVPLYTTPVVPEGCMLIGKDDWEECKATFFTAPQARHLSDEEILDIYGEKCDSTVKKYVLEFARAVLKEASK